ncbi:MAG: IMP dehydrogenase [Candidatus Margulisiibacteriota bacterium]|nr:MAG: inosine 5-monophosphate dehydrogenase [Candidatus Margulisbacteria bacterium GWD2_39_127]OGI05442.1 MAG: inosine 5-monophosphate dehydrogenase [Candidatus Margulisbacteria bacterium GWF2_38_17]OGI07820.1 MAG: inosine 5-monophosphate dehydrogenase [Candidatus Margulisbacteria bacterium GWE2_39_32]PZM80124.1 MAG: IMP dehydrogenase [Candidatus Margulisiibacteriota bacterium]HAR62610.1 IMP dehydrogenase [Candidatus Margulisiibacteriota bacterium]
MVFVYPEVSRTFSEYLLVPNLTAKDCTPENISLKTPLVRFNRGAEPAISLNIPFVSAIMQSVSDHNMSIALARSGGLSFIYGSQSIETQVDMIKKAKKYKAGFVLSDTNLTERHTLREVLDVTQKTGHSTIAITDDGTANGKLLGLVTSKDYRLTRDSLEKPVHELMTCFEKLIIGNHGITLSEANDIIWEHKINCLPIVDANQKLRYMVFRKDYEDHKQNPNTMMDKDKRLIVGAGINTRDYKERVPLLVEAGVDILCIDSSDGFSQWQREAIEYIKSYFGDKVKIGGGNVVDREGFKYLVDAGADFVKVGIGGGSICITREQKGIGRGQASSIIDTAAYRDELYKETGTYIPICSDGGIVHDYHIVLALAMGADFVMMGRYFARFDESPAKKIKLGNRYVKEYWGEGSNKARNWQRYDAGDTGTYLKFEEGVDSYVPYAGKLKDNLDVTIHKIKSTMCSCGAKTIRQLQDTARLTAVSSTSIKEGGAHDVILKE